MEYKEIGNSRIPVLGLGTWEIGGRLEPDSSLRKDWIKTIREAIELGITHIDTSEIYGNGLTEEIIGEAISSFDRKKLFITSKLWNTNLSYKDALSSLNKSLKRLKTDYLDLYLVHWPNDNTDIKETMKAFEHAQGEKIVKFVGVSNFSIKQIQEAQSCLSNSKINAVQDEYNLLKRNEQVLELCSRQKILFIAYRPLMKGQLAKPGIGILDRLAEKYAKTQSQIALNWLLSKQQIVAIPKASKKEHMLDNLGAIGWKMEKQDYNKLDSLHHEIV